MDLTYVRCAQGCPGPQSHVVLVHGADKDRFLVDGVLVCDPDYPEARVHRRLCADCAGYVVAAWGDVTVYPIGRDVKA